MEKIQKKISELKEERIQRFRDLEEAEMLTRVELLRYVKDVLDAPSNQRVSLQAIDLYAKLAHMYDKVDDGGKLDVNIEIKAPEGLPDVNAWEKTGSII